MKIPKNKFVWGKIVELLEFRVIDTYNLLKRLLDKIKNHRITTASYDRYLKNFIKDMLEQEKKRRITRVSRNRCV